MRARMVGSRLHPQKGEQVADLLDRVRDELATRLTELRPLVDEHERLEAALRALSDAKAPVRTPRAAQSAGPDGSGAARATAPAPARKRAPRGANRAAVLRAAEQRPGASGAELAVASGVERNTLYALLARLVNDGELQKRELPTGKTGYALSSDART